MQVSVALRNKGLSGTKRKSESSKKIGDVEGIWLLSAGIKLLWKVVELRINTLEEERYAKGYSHRYSCLNTV